MPQVGAPRPGQVSKEDLELVEQRTQELVHDLGAFRPDQFNNPNSVAAHEHTTGREVWEQTGGRVGAFVASFVMSEVIAISGVIWSTEMGYVIAFVVFIVMIFVRPGGILTRRG